MALNSTQVEEQLLSAAINTKNKLSVIEGNSRAFGNINIYLHSLGAAAYRLEWYSRMSGTSTSISRLSMGKYVATKIWPKNRKLPIVSSDFENRKAALNYFINNVDILKASTEAIYEAKKHCLELFTALERISPISKPTFQKLRLQGAIGRAVEVKSKTSEETIVEGTLIQLIGSQAEVKIEKHYNLSTYKPFQKFTTHRVFIK